LQRQSELTKNGIETQIMKNSNEAYKQPNKPNSYFKSNCIGSGEGLSPSLLSILIFNEQTFFSLHSLKTKKKLV